jgi:hypothetical protein
MMTTTETRGPKTDCPNCKRYNANRAAYCKCGIDLSNGASLAAQLAKQCDELARREVHVETNQGTYGANEACRKVGTGDPAFANREVYETVGGTRRETGPDANDAPGRMRKIGYDALRSLRAELKKLRSEAEKAAKNQM